MGSIAEVLEWLFFGGRQKACGSRKSTNAVPFRSESYSAEAEKLSVPLESVRFQQPRPSNGSWADPPSSSARQRPGGGKGDSSFEDYDELYDSSGVLGVLGPRSSAV